MNSSRLRIATVLAVSTVLVLAARSQAWGPHPQITRAAQDVLPEREKAAAYFGKEWNRFQEYCWLGDWRSSVRDDFYPDDYLLFPQAPRHYDHLVPDVRHTYEPFFRRALQALRTETPTNSARWIGSLMHFVEDTGSPPHAASITGELHTRMENWLDAKAIGITGYSPKLLGNDDDSALAGFLARIEGLIEFSKLRAEKMREHVTALKEREDLPLSLESANETARVCADLLHTLFVLGLDAPAKKSLSGHITWPSDLPLPTHGAKIILLGTSFSTVTDPSGFWEFRNLPTLDYKIAVQRCGAGPVIGTDLNVTLIASDPPGNRVRNLDFKLSWINPNLPDHWIRIDRLQRLKGFESANIAVKAGETYRIGAADAQPGTRLGVRWRQHPAITQTATTDTWDTAADHDVTAPAGATYAQVLILTEQPLTKSAGRVWLVSVPKR